MTFTHTLRTKARFGKKITLCAIAFVLTANLIPFQAFADTNCDTSAGSTTPNNATACQKDVYSSGVYYFDVGTGEDAQSCAVAGDDSLVGNDAVQKIMNYFTNPQGPALTAPQAAGIVGNIQTESAGTFNPRIIQGLDANGKQRYGDAPVSNLGYGLSQWTSAGRQQDLVSLAQSEGKSPGDMGVQLDFIWQELNGGYKPALTALQATSTPQAAAVVIMVQYEMPKDHDPNGANAKARSKHAADALIAYGASTTDPMTPAPPTTSDSTDTSSSCTDGGGGPSGPVQAGQGFIGNCAGQGSTAPIHCGQCVIYVEWALGAHADPSKGPYGSLTDQSGPLRYAASTVVKNLGAKGFTVDTTPAVHATFSMSGAAGALGNHWGHTGIVSQVNTDSNGKLVSIVVEQSNWSPSDAELYNNNTVFTVAQLQKEDTTFAHTEVGWH